VVSAHGVGHNLAQSDKREVIVNNRWFCSALLTAFALFGTDALGQGAASCPTIKVSCPDQVDAGKEMTFTANVSGGDSNVTPTYNWTVSAGSIRAGQGTSTITVDTTGAAGQWVTATVDIGGYSRECSTSDSCTGQVNEEAKPSVKFGEYVTRDLEANKEMLDEFVIALQNDPEAQGYVIAYGGRTSGPSDAQTAADRATTYMVETRKMDGARTLAGVGGYREEPTIELWISPPGGAQPMATPTVAPEDVKPKAK
jgi:hypothetical protein